MAIKKDQEEFIEELTNPIQDIMDEVNYNVLSTITNRIKSIGKMTPSDAGRLSQIVRMQDIDSIESIIAAGTNLSTEKIDSILTESAKNNDDLAENLYKARNIQPNSFITDSSLFSIVESAKKNIVDGIVNLSSTTGFMIDGKMTDLSRTYNYAINRAIFEVQQGIFDYNTSMRSVITKLASSGIRTVDFASGYSRRLDSQVRMNVMDGIRQMNMDYRQEQASQFGADIVFISWHYLCAADHIQINGKQFDADEWEEINNNLKRQVGTMNCKHYVTYGIKGISTNPISSEERKSAKNNSNKVVEYDTLRKDSDGNHIKKSIGKYDFSQVQRKTETDIRKLKDSRNQLEILGDNVGVAEYNKRIKSKTAYYKKISKQGELSPKTERLSVIK